MHERIGRIDANKDGFITRAEAQSEAERVFGEMDGDNNGKLDSADRAASPRMMIHHMSGDGHRRGGGRHGDDDHNVEVIVRGGDGEERTVIERREVRVERAAPKEGAVPRPPRPPGPPMTMMMIMQSNEADRNGDGALSKEEFVAQQLRYFDAGDANGDGKVKFDLPPMPPAAPPPPAPPEAPRR
jgi:hypothetical protein